jgi:hypothetical protein
LCESEDEENIYPRYYPRYSLLFSQLASSLTSRVTTLFTRMPHITSLVSKLQGKHGVNTRCIDGINLVSLALPAA